MSTLPTLNWHVDCFVLVHATTSPTASSSIAGTDSTSSLHRLTCTTTPTWRECVQATSTAVCTPSGTSSTPISASNVTPSTRLASPFQDSKFSLNLCSFHRLLLFNQNFCLVACVPKRFVTKVYIFRSSPTYFEAIHILH